MLGLTQIRRFAWADDDPNLAWTVAVATGTTASELVRAYGGDPEQPPSARTFAQAQVPPADLGTCALVQVHTEGRHLVAVENNGWLGQRADIAERASLRGGRFMGIYWSLNANYKVTQAIDGALVAHFDPLSIQHPAPIGEVYPDWISGVAFSDESLHATLLAVLQDQTGLAFDRGWLDVPLPTYRIPSRPPDCSS